MKAVLESSEAVISEAAGAAHVESFALKVFMSADNDDRNGVTGKPTIRKFVVAGQFIEVLRCFENGMTEEVRQVDRARNELIVSRWSRNSRMPGGKLQMAPKHYEKGGSHLRVHVSWSHNHPES